VRVLLTVFVARLRPALIGVRMSGVVVALRALQVVRVGLVSTGILMVPEHLALAGRDRRHRLDRNDQGQQQDGKKAGESSRHRRPL